MIGGFLADPAEQYPKHFGNNAFFLKYRYALPCFAGALFPLIGIVVGIFFLQEVRANTLMRQTCCFSFLSKHILMRVPFQSLPTAKRAKAQKDDESGAPLVAEELPGIRSLLTRRVCLTLTNYAMLAFTSIANAGIFPLFLYTRISLGGLELKPAQVSIQYNKRSANDVAIDSVLLL